MSSASAYPARVWELFLTAPGAGLPDAKGDWVAAEAMEPLSATHVRFYLSVGAGVIDAIRYQIRGCPYTVAAAAWLAGRWAGANLADVQIEPRAILAELSAPVTKLGRILLVEEAFRKGLLAAAANA